MLITGLGLLAALVTPGHRLALVPALAALIMLTLVAFLAGALPRYRYPADPLLAVLQVGGLAALFDLLRRLPKTAFRARGADPPRAVAVD